MIDVNNGLLKLDGLLIKDGDILRGSKIALSRIKCDKDINSTFKIIDVGNNIPKNTFWNRLKKLFHKSKTEEIWYDIMLEKIR